MASGIGKRMQSPNNQAKQYLKLDNGLSILDTTLSGLLDLPIITSCIVVLADNDTEFAQSDYKNHPKLLTTTIGGVERHNSVFNALTQLKNWAKPDDWVLVHDGVRACITAKDVNNLIQTIGDDSVGGLLASPMVSTLKSVDENNKVIKTVKRDYLWQAQTPQMFRFDKLSQALTSVINNNISITDDAQAMELLGFSPIVVPSSENNIKITHPDDINRANQILSDIT